MLKKRVLITGVAGLLGSHLADKFLELGFQVIGIDNLVGGYPENVPQGIIFYKADCRDFKKMQEITGEFTPEIIIHAACTAYEGLSVFSPSLIFDNTASATISVLSAGISSGMKKFVFCSSMARYGDHNGIQFTEDLMPRPQDPYGIAKVAAEEVTRNLASAHGFEYVILVPHNIIGPRQKYDDPYRNVAAIMINRMLNGLPPIIYGDGEQTRSFSFISDVVDPIVKASLSADANSQVINVGPDNNEITINQLAKMIANLVGYKGDFMYVPDRPQEVKHASCSADKARTILGFNDLVSVKEGLIQMIQYIENSGKKPFSYDFDLEIVNELTPLTWKNKLI